MKPQSFFEKLLFSTIMIETECSSAKGVGTGFFIHYQLPNSQYFPVIVTNRHVVEFCEKCEMNFTLLENGEPNINKKIKYILDKSDTKWFFHPDINIDIALLPMMPIDTEIKEKGNSIFYIPIDQTFFPSDDQIKDMDAVENVMFWGYPDGIWDSVHNLPIMRRGITATPVYIDYENRPIFLIDASVFQGSSGSPVFRVIQGWHTDKNGSMTTENSISFLGVLTEVFYKNSKLEVITTYISKKRKQEVKNEEVLDLGLVYKAKYVKEIIELYLKEKQFI